MAAGVGRPFLFIYNSTQIQNMKKYIHLLVIGVTIAATAWAVGSQPKSVIAATDCPACAGCTDCGAK